MSQPETFQAISANPYPVTPGTVEMPDSLVASGDQALLEGRLWDAIEIFLTGREAGPHSVYPRVRLAQAYCELADFQGAVSTLHAVLKDHPACVEAHLVINRLRKTPAMASSVWSFFEAVSEGFSPNGQSLEQARARISAHQAQLASHLAELEGGIGSTFKAMHEFFVQQTRQRLIALEEDLRLINYWGRLEEERRAQEERLAAEQAAREASEQEARNAAVAADEARRQEALEEERAQEEQRQAALQQIESQLDTLRNELDPHLQVVLKTKGVAAIYVFLGSDRLLHQAATEPPVLEHVKSFVNGAADVLGPDTPLGAAGSWVLEFVKGILYVQRLEFKGHVSNLVLVGLAGANMGVLTHSINKNRAALEGVLGSHVALLFPES